MKKGGLCFGGIISQIYPKFGSPVPAKNGEKSDGLGYLYRKESDDEEKAATGLA